MRKVILSFILGLIATQSCFALLPPYYQSVTEITAILKDTRLGDSLGSGEPIQDIQKNENGYLITSPKYHIQVNVTYLKQDHPGPAKFELHFQRTALAEEQQK